MAQSNSIISNTTTTTVPGKLAFSFQSKSANTAASVPRPTTILQQLEPQIDTDVDTDTVNRSRSIPLVIPLKPNKPILIQPLLTPIPINSAAAAALLSDAESTNNANNASIGLIISDKTIPLTTSSTSVPVSEFDYNSIPVEEFGSAMLRGMGWTGPTDTVGLTNKQLVKPVELNARMDRRGLGTDLVNKSINSIIPSKPITIAEQLGERLISIESVINNNNNNKRPLDSNNATTTSNTDNKRIKSLHQWIVPNIRVRIINDKHKYYNSKCIVQSINNNDNTDTNTIKLLLDNSNTNIIIDNLLESDLETIIPKLINSTILILRGLYRGELGRLINRDNKLNRANIELSNSKFNQKIVDLSFDDIAEFIQTK